MGEYEVLSRECADDKEKHQYADRYYNHLHKMYFVNKEGENSTLTREEILRRLPDFPAQKLGTCAIVGNADNVLEGKYGEEIDEHDFVVRFNVVTKPFSEFVGTKAGGMLVKTNYKDTEYKRDVVPTMYNLFPKVSVRISSRPSKETLDTETPVSETPSVSTEAAKLQYPELAEPYDPDYVYEKGEAV